MTATAHRPVLPEELDPFRPEHLDDPYPLYAELRSRGPAVYLEDRNVWLVTRYDAMSRVLRDHRDFLSGLGTSYVRVTDSGFRFPFIDNDGAEHTRVRRSVQADFNRGPIAELQPVVAGLVAEVLAGPLERGQADVATTIARQLPDLTIRHMTGLAPPDSDTVAAWADATFHLLGPEPDPKYLELVLAALDWLAAEGVPGLPAHCMGRTIMDFGGNTGGLHTDGTERLYALASVFLAAVDTTNGLIANMINAFAAHPDQWDAVRADPSLIPAAVEEVLRWDSPIRVFLRRTAHPVDLDGVRLPGDANVCALFPAANRDPEAFIDPDRFDVRAQRPKTHLAFGASVHLCIGAPVARLEAAELLAALVRDVSQFAYSAEPERTRSRVIRSFQTLPISFIPA